MHKSKLLTLFLVMFIVVSFLPMAAPGTGRPARAEGDVPRFEEAECQLDELPDGFTEGDNLICGYVIVPEDRTDPETRTIKLAVAIFRSTGDNAENTPTIFLQGGPGGPSIRDFSKRLIEMMGEQLLEQGDFIFLDQRGTGLSEPKLTCDELYEVTEGILRGEDDEAKRYVLERYLNRDQGRTSERGSVSPYVRAIQECEQRLSKVARLSAYTSVSNAADLNDLRIALGYEKLNLYGVSYGTKLALTAMRDFPDMLRAVILDSVYPLQADLFASSESAERAFNVLFNGCRDNRTCNRAFPNLENTFYTLVTKLNKKPARVEAMIDGKKYRIPVNGTTLINIMFKALYSTTIIPTLPALIVETNKGDYDRLGELIGRVYRYRDFSDGMYFSVQCTEEAPFTTREAVERDLKNVHPAIREAFAEDYVLQACEVWDYEAGAAVENQPVISDVPTLVLAGEYDPITPPSWSRMAATTLSRSFYYEFPGVGHGAWIADKCAQEIGLAFLADPASEPDASCLEDAAGPKFVTK